MDKVKVTELISNLCEHSHNNFRDFLFNCALKNSSYNFIIWQENEPISDEFLGCTISLDNERILELFDEPLHKGRNLIAIIDNNFKFTYINTKIIALH